MISFEIMHEGDTAPANLKQLGVHMVFYIKNNTTHRERLVGGLHRNKDSKSSTYVSVVSIDTVHIAVN